MRKNTIECPRCCEIVEYDDDEIEQFEKDSTQKPIPTERLFADLRTYKKALEEIAKSHRGCEDGFYACPQSEDYFGGYENLPINDRPCHCDAGTAITALGRE